MYFAHPCVLKNAAKVLACYFCSRYERIDAFWVLVGVIRSFDFSLFAFDNGAIRHDGGTLNDGKKFDMLTLGGGLNIEKDDGSCAEIALVVAHSPGVEFIRQWFDGVDSCKGRKAFALYLFFPQKYKGAGIGKIATGAISFMARVLRRSFSDLAMY